MAKSVQVPLDKPVRMLLVFSFGIGLCFGVGMLSGVLLEKHVGVSRDKAYSSAKSSYSTAQYKDILETGKKIGAKQSNLDNRVHSVSIEGRKWFENRVEQKMDEAYQQGWKAGKKSVKNGPFYNKTTTINFTGKISKGGTTFDFVESVDGVVGDSYTGEEAEKLTGFSYPSESRIEIKTGYSASFMDKTCNHEMLHLMFPGFSHPSGDEKYDDPIYTLTEEVDLRICNSVIKEAIELSK